MADSSCTDWSNLRHTGRIYDFRRYLFDLDLNERVSRYNACFGSIIARCWNNKCVILSSGCIQYQIIAFENPDIRNNPRICPRIFDIIRKFWGRVGCEKIDVRWGTNKFTPTFSTPVR